MVHLFFQILAQLILQAFELDDSFPLLFQSNHYIQLGLTYSYYPLTVTYSEGSALAGKTGTVIITASANSTSTWVFGYNVQGVTKYITPATAGVQSQTFAATLDSNGSVIINLVVGTGAYGISGVEFIFD